MITMAPDNVKKEQPAKVEAEKPKKVQRLRKRLQRSK